MTLHLFGASAQVARCWHRSCDTSFAIPSTHQELAMTRTQYTVRIAVALAFVFAAGISVAVVAPPRARAVQAVTPAVRLPTIVVRPQAQDAAAQPAALQDAPQDDLAQASL
jgi:hypothetical protein